ncbi:MAG: hypothetical protein ACTHJM_12130 [Marmoricola sp.]
MSAEQGRIEAILEGHELELSVFISDIGTCAAPDCDWRKGSMRNGEVAAAHRAHVASLIAAQPSVAAPTPERCVGCGSTSAECIETDGGCCADCRASVGESHEGTHGSSSGCAGGTLRWEPAPAPAPEDEQREALASLIDEAYPYTVHGGLRKCAEAILASDWLREHDAKVIEAAAAKARAAWAPNPCPWVGFLDDEAKAIREAGERR